MSGEAIWGLDRNLALMAGAGTGKTHSLITLCLHLLGGARESRLPLPMEKLRLVTFTEKAAGEMKERLHQRVARLATDVCPDEPVLQASFARLGLEPPAPEFWRERLLRLGSVGVGTFHALCIELLRQAEPAVGSLEILGEWDAQALLRDVAERTVLDALESAAVGAAALCEEFSFSGRGRAPGLVDNLTAVLRKVREEGVAPSEIPASDPEAAREAFTGAVAELRDTVDQALSLLEGRGREKFGAALEETRAGLRSLRFENAWEGGRLRTLESEIAALSLVGQHRNPAIGPLKSIKARLCGGDKSQPTLRDHSAAVRAGALEGAFVSLLAEVARRYGNALRERGAVDFSELLIRARDLLRDRPAFRHEVQGQLGALLVDEFQDTNRLQWELVALLSERREGAPRALSPLPGSQVVALPLEPGFLCIVGDRKQSIYEFRGADVSVFGQLADKLEGEGGARVHLRDNFRSTPALLEFFNKVSLSTMGEGLGGEADAVVYRPEEDDLQPRREGCEPVPVERLSPVDPDGADSKVARKLEAEKVALRLRKLLDGPAPVDPGDVALLFRRFTHLEVYRRALAAQGIPHRVRRGRGFFAAPEVVDAASMLSLLGDSDRKLALATVLRSPWVGLSDESLFQLALGGGGVLSLPLLQERPELSDALPEGEREPLRAFLLLYGRLRAERLRMGVAPLLKALLREGGLRAAWAALPSGESALTGLDRLVELAERWDSESRGDCDAFARELLERAEANSAEDDVAAEPELEDQAAGAVQLLTVHSAKGLEFPVVLLPDLAAPLNSARGRVIFDRRLGLSIRPSVPDSARAPNPPRHRLLCAELDRRERAEHKRLLYVALTRARDRLILADAPAKTRRGQTWSGLIEASGAWEGGAQTPIAELGLAPSQGSVGLKAVGLEEGLARWELGVREAIDRLGNRAADPVAARREIALDWLTGIPSGEEGGVRAVHRHLLTTVDFALFAQPGSDRLRAHLRDCVRSAPAGGAPSFESLIERWMRWAGSAWALELAAMPAWRIRRAVHFRVRLSEASETSPEVLLRGQLDLLVQSGTDRFQALRIEPGSGPTGDELRRWSRPLVDGYRLAGSRMVGSGGQLSVGVVFLGDPEPSPHLFEAAFDDERFIAVPALMEGAKRLGELAAGSVPP